MSDIGKLIRAGAVDDPDRFDRAGELAGWTRETAVALAAKEGLELDDRHWAVLHHLRAHFMKNGAVEHARDLADELDEHFKAQGGRKYLFELFPGGPVTQGGRLAGIPVPADSRQPSFGSVF